MKGTHVPARTHACMQARKPTGRRPPSGNLLGNGDENSSHDATRTTRMEHALALKLALTESSRSIQVNASSFIIDGDM
jgi:hypothetical protein